MAVKLDVPFHVRTALLNITKLRDQVDLIISVADARCPITTDLSTDLYETLGIKVLSLTSKLDLSDINNPNTFNFKDPKNKKTIIKLIKETLDTNNKYPDIYKPPLQVLIVGLPNTGKSTLINLLKGKKVAISENIPGKTKKISKFPIGDNIWIYDTPGIFMKNKLPPDSIEKLFFLNSIPSTIKDYSPFLEKAYKYLYKHYLPLLSRTLGFNPPEEYSYFLECLSIKYNFRLSENRFDTERAELKFLNLVRGGKLKINWDRN